MITEAEQVWVWQATEPAGRTQACGPRPRCQALRELMASNPQPWVKQSCISFSRGQVSDSVGRVSRSRCTSLSGAGHFLMRQYIIPIFQMAALRLSVEALAQRLRSWATGQVLVSVLISVAAQVPWSQSTAFSGLESSHQAPRESLLEAHGSPQPSNPSVVEGKGAGVWLEQLTCLKGQPVEESRSRNTWAWELSDRSGSRGLSNPHVP